MKIIKNIGNESVVDEMYQTIAKEAVFGMVTSAFSLMAFGEIHKTLEQLKSYRLVILQSEQGIKTG
jgi:hypothetical protein